MAPSSLLMPGHISSALRISEFAVDKLRFANLLAGEAFFLRFVPILFGVCAYLSSVHTASAASVAAIWPANGILLAALLLTGDDSQRRAKVLILCFLANVVANIAVGQPRAATVGFALINIGEGWLAYFLLVQLRAADPGIVGIRPLLRFVLALALAAIAPAVAGGALASICLGAKFEAALTTWYMADLLGLLVVAPAFAKAFRPEPDIARERPAWVLPGMTLLLLATSALVFGQSSYPLLFILMPVCVTIAFQLGLRHASLATLFLTAVSIYATYNGSGPAALIGNADPASKVWLVQLFCVVNHFTTVFVAAAVAQRDAMSRRNEALSKTEAESRQRLDAALNAMNQGFCLFDERRCVAAYNERFLELYGLHAADVIVGMTFDELTRQSSQRGLSARSASVALNLMTQGDTDQTLTDGRVIRICQRRIPGVGVVCTYTDVTSERLAESDLRHASRHDPLTGLANRRYFRELLAQRCAGAAAERFSLMFIDVDHFKTVNDHLGHLAGDGLLQAVGRRIESCTRDVDTVARLGGDEFAVILQGADLDKAGRIAERMLSIAREPVFVEGHVALVTLSIGIAGHAAHKSPDELMNEADMALYAVKQRGRNGVEVASAERPAAHIDMASGIATRHRQAS